MTRGEPAGEGAVGGDVRPASRRHRRGAGPAGARPDDHLRLRARRSSGHRGPGPVRARRPAARRAARLPHFPGDALDPTTSGGDLCVQACADDPQVAVHAVRNLARIGFGTVVGALVAARLRAYVDDLDVAVDASQPLRLQGRHRQRQGRGGDCADEHVWVGDERPGAGCRRLLPRRPPDGDGHRGLGPPAARRPGGFVGRTKGTGAPLSGGEGDDRARLRHARQQRPAGDPRRRTRQGRPPRRARRRADAAPRLQLRRRLQRPRRARRRALLHRLRPRPGHPLRAGPARDVEVPTP